jgi:mannose-1-phosphate guanylyltransferase
MKKKPYSVIIAGGKGTRFWPLSRSLRPKQLLKLFGRKSLITQTVERVQSVSGADQTLVVTVSEQLEATRKELPALPRRNFIAEPQGKNTAPCIGLAALEVVRRDSDAVMIVLPADHWIVDVPAFRRTLKAAANLAVADDHLITIGIQPTYPETGYGYIVKDKPLGNHKIAAYKVTSFKEKPDVKLAQELISQGSLWNAGIFISKASMFLDLIGRYQPKIWQNLEKIRQAASGRSLSQTSVGVRSTVDREYRKMPSISIDHAIVEGAGKDGRVITMVSDFGWSDVGSWAAVHRMSKRDADGNAGTGKWLGLGAKDSLIYAGERLVVLLGMEDAIVVDTPDAVLVGDLKRSQEVRELVEHLKKVGYGSYTVK